MPETHDTAGMAFGEFFERRRKVEEAVIAQWESLSAKQKRQRLVVEYFCANKAACPLLRLWQSDYGLAMYRPPYVLSEEINLANSNEAGRANNTTDGNNHWAAHVTLWTTPHEQFGLQLACPHTLTTVRTLDIHEDALSSQPGRPKRRRIRHAAGVGMNMLESVTQS